MAIRQDAGEILLYVYSKKVTEGKIPTPEDLLEVTKWKPLRLSHALDYCEEKRFLRIEKFLGSIAPGLQAQFIMDLTSWGVDVVESATDDGSVENSFNATFNLNVNINNPTIELTFGKISLLGM